ncbi:DUF1232 domain-containing protein [Actinokineospora sp. 24-640]
MLVVLIAASAAVTVRLLLNLVRWHEWVTHAAPWVRTAYWTALCYAAVPVDLMTEPVLVDDIAVLVAASALVARSRRKPGTDRVGGR